MLDHTPNCVHCGTLIGTDTTPASRRGSECVLCGCEAPSSSSPLPAMPRLVALLALLMQGLVLAPAPAAAFCHAFPAQGRGRGALCSSRSGGGGGGGGGGGQGRHQQQQQQQQQQKKENLGSYYKRPSAAIERGGGFFVPGLEGYRLRLAMGGVAAVLLVLNRFPGYTVDPSQLRSEGIAAVASFLLIGQAAVDMLRMQISADRELQQADDDGTLTLPVAGGEGGVAYIASTADSSLGERLRFAAATILRLSPASALVVVQKDSLLAT
jgi:hypothetical protein